MHIKKILHVNQSIERYSQISNLDKSLDIQHNPRVRKDISKIYFLTDYDLGKTIVPIFKNYALNSDINKNNKPFKIPNGITFINIDPKTGRPSNNENSIMEPFIKSPENLSLIHI